MATAGTPESARPVSGRSATNVMQFGAKEAASVAAAAAASEAVMIALRPTMSESVPAKTMAIANTPVAADKDRLAAAGEIEKARVKGGIKGWTQESSGKVAKLPRNSAKLTRQKRAPPRPIRGGSPAGAFSFTIVGVDVTG